MGPTPPSIRGSLPQNSRGGECGRAVRRGHADTTRTAQTHSTTARPARKKRMFRLFPLRPKGNPEKIVALPFTLRTVRLLWPTADVQVRGSVAELLYRSPLDANRSPRICCGIRNGR